MNSHNEPSSSNDVRIATTLSQVAELLCAHGAEYALIGGLAVALRGNVRATQDIDVLMHIPQLRLPALLEAMREVGCTLDVPTSIREWNEGGMLAIQWPARVCVDLLKPVVGTFQRIIERAREESFQGQTIRVADADGLILLKLLAFRPLDQEDIRGILTKNAGLLDLDWVRSEADAVGVNERHLLLFEEFVREFYVES